MDLLTISLTFAILLILFLGGSIWIFISLALVGFGSFYLFTDLPFGPILANMFWNNTSGAAMMALPLFVFMGEILFRSKISENLFSGLCPWMDAIPGRLIHVNIFACTLFAAISGSSAATTSTVGKITIPELTQRGYDKSLSIGSLAGSGTLGFLIPPSMMMLVYGMIAEVSIGKLFIAGFIPGFMLALMFSSYTIIRCLNNQNIAPSGKAHYSWRERMQAIPLLAPVIILIFIVLGSIYMGWATPTEAAAVGVAGALFFALLTRGLNWEAFKTALMGSVKTSCMIMAIVCGAAYLSVAVSYLGITRSLTEYVGFLNLSPYTLIAILSIMYIGLGCLVDGFSMIVMSTPIALPLITAAGFDPLWFGIYLVLMIQLAQITPPVGFNLFVINNLTGDDLWTIAKAAFPFFIMLCIGTALITFFPKIVLFLPSTMIR